MAILSRTNFSKLAFLLLATISLVPGCSTDRATQGVSYRKQHTTADKAMVVSAHRLASEIGVQVMRDGGNAVDAAVAVHWALAVTAPWAGNIGGGGFMVGRQADGSTWSIDFRETAPLAASRDMFLDAQGNALPESSLVGHRAVGVPGSVAGMYAIHDSLGRLPMARLIQPAIDIAFAGFPLSALEVHDLNHRSQVIRRASTTPNPYIAKEKWQVGDLLVQPELGRTLERIREGGTVEFYQGTTAQLLLEEMQRGSGLITAEDLAVYTPVWRAPVTGKYRDLEIITMGPPSSGGVVMLQVLAGLELIEQRDGPGDRTAQLHRLIEMERRAFADRSTHMGDPDHVDVPLATLLCTGHVSRRLADFDPYAATPSLRIAQAAVPRSSEQTTHLSIVDPEGNSVSCTTTLNGWYGSGVVVGGAGFVLNNEMDDFSTAPGLPNHYGLIGGEANAIAPGKRMVSSMAPTIVTRHGHLYMVVGTPGGSTIPSTTLQAILNVVDLGMDMQQAVDAPRIHHQWLPDTVQMEARALSGADSTTLVRMGHTFRQRPPMGRVDAIRILPDGRLEAGADPRGDDHAAGF